MAVLEGDELAAALLEVAKGLEERVKRFWFFNVLGQFVITDPLYDEDLGDLMRNIAEGLISSADQIDLTGVELDTAEMERLLMEAVGQAGETLARTSRIGIEFGLGAEEQARALQQVTLRTRSMTDTLKDRVRQIFRDHFANPASTQRALERAIANEVGLLPAHAQAANRYEAELRAQGSSAAEAQRLADAYRKRLLEWRADLIARTEVARAMSIGQREFWQQVDRELYLPPGTQRVWIAQLDEKTCPICGEGGGGHGSLAPLDGPFQTAYGTFMDPTDSHPGCRCAQGLRLPELSMVEIDALLDNPYQLYRVGDTVIEQTVRVGKHQPGSHDQQSHGNWARGRSITLANENVQSNEEWWEEYKAGATTSGKFWAGDQNWEQALSAAMNTWRSSFINSSNIRAVMEGRMPAPGYVSTANPNDIPVLDRALDTAPQLGRESWRLVPDEAPGPGDTVDIPIASVAFERAEAEGYRGSFPMSAGSPTLYRLTNARGLEYEDGREAIVRGRFTVESVEEGTDPQGQPVSVVTLVEEVGKHYGPGRHPGTLTAQTIHKPKSQQNTDVEDNLAAIQAMVGEEPNSGDVYQDLLARDQQWSPYVTEAARSIALAGVQMLVSDLTALGGDPADIREFAMLSFDALLAQEYVANGRVLGDHGVHHLMGDALDAIHVAQIVMEGQGFGELGPAERVQLLVAGMFHDMGYMADVPLGQDGQHPIWGQRYYDDVVSQYVARLVGVEQADALSGVIQTHAGTTMDWSSPEQTLASAFRLADNLALFQPEKLPAIVRHVPDNIPILEQLWTKAITVDEAQSAMLANVEAADWLTPQQREPLVRAIGEVSEGLPKFLMGMMSGRLTGTRWDAGRNRLEVELERDISEDGFLRTHLDLGNRQFKKFAETYHITEEDLLEDNEFDFGDAMHVVITGESLTGQVDFVTLADGTVIPLEIVQDDEAELMAELPEESEIAASAPEGDPSVIVDRFGPGSVVWAYGQWWEDQQLGKHLPGGHDQKRHGNWAHGRSGSESEPGSEAKPGQVPRMTPMEFATSGPFSFDPDRAPDIPTVEALERRVAELMGAARVDVPDKDGKLPPRQWGERRVVGLTHPKSVDTSGDPDIFPGLPEDYEFDPEAAGAIVLALEEMAMAWPEAFGQLVEISFHPEGFSDAFADGTVGLDKDNVDVEAGFGPDGLRLFLYPTLASVQGGGFGEKKTPAQVYATVLHEFAHVLHYNSVRGRVETSAEPNLDLYWSRIGSVGHAIFRTQFSSLGFGDGPPSNWSRTARAMLVRVVMAQDVFPVNGVDVSVPAFNASDFLWVGRESRGAQYRAGPVAWAALGPVTWSELVRQDPWAADLAAVSDYAEANGAERYAEAQTLDWLGGTVAVEVEDDHYQALGNIRSVGMWASEEGEFITLPDGTVIPIEKHYAPIHPGTGSAQIRHGYRGRYETAKTMTIAEATEALADVGIKYREKVRKQNRFTDEERAAAVGALHYMARKYPEAMARLDMVEVVATEDYGGAVSLRTGRAVPPYSPYTMTLQLNPSYIRKSHDNQAGAELRYAGLVVDAETGMPGPIIDVRRNVTYIDPDQRYAADPAEGLPDTVEIARRNAIHEVGHVVQYDRLMTALGVSTEEFIRAAVKQRGIHSIEGIALETAALAETKQAFLEGTWTPELGQRQLRDRGEVGRALDAAKDRLHQAVQYTGYGDRLVDVSTSTLVRAVPSGETWFDEPSRQLAPLVSSRMFGEITPSGSAWAGHRAGARLVSLYATESPWEAFAESFLAKQMGIQYPPELDRWLGRTMVEPIIRPPGYYGGTTLQPAETVEFVTLPDGRVVPIEKSAKVVVEDDVIRIEDDHVGGLVTVPILVRHPDGSITGLATGPGAIEKHYGPGPHPGTGSLQLWHGHRGPWETAKSLTVDQSMKALKEIFPNWNARLGRSRKILKDIDSDTARAALVSTLAQMARKYPQAASAIVCLELPDKGDGIFSTTPLGQMKEVKDGPPDFWGDKTFQGHFAVGIDLVRIQQWQHWLSSSPGDALVETRPVEAVGPEIDLDANKPAATNVAALPLQGEIGDRMIAGAPSVEELVRRVAIHEFAHVVEFEAMWRASEIEASRYLQESDAARALKGEPPLSGWVRSMLPRLYYGAISRFAHDQSLARATAPGVKITHGADEPSPWVITDTARNILDHIADVGEQALMDPVSRYADKRASEGFAESFLAYHMGLLRPESALARSMEQWTGDGQAVTREVPWPPTPTETVMAARGQNAQSHDVEFITLPDGTVVPLIDYEALQPARTARMEKADTDDGFLRIGVPEGETFSGSLVLAIIPGYPGLRGEVEKHYGPGPHPGTGSSQSYHSGVLTHPFTNQGMLFPPGDPDTFGDPMHAPPTPDWQPVMTEEDAYAYLEDRLGLEVGQGTHVSDAPEMVMQRGFVVPLENTHSWRGLTGHTSGYGDGVYLVPSDHDLAYSETSSYESEVGGDAMTVVYGAKNMLTVHPSREYVVVAGLWQEEFGVGHYKGESWLTWEDIYEQGGVEWDDPQSVREFTEGLIEAGYDALYIDDPGGWLDWPDEEEFPTFVPDGPDRPYGTELVRTPTVGPQVVVFNPRHVIVVDESAPPMATEFITLPDGRVVPVEKHYGPGPHPGTGNPQTVHGGHGAGPGERKMLTAFAVAEGGYTWDDNRHLMVMGDPEGGPYMVAPNKDTEEKFSIAEGEWGSAAILDYIRRHEEELRPRDAHLGAWVEAGAVWLDVSVACATPAAAARLAKKADQEAYFDLGTMTTYYRNPDGRYVPEGDPSLAKHLPGQHDQSSHGNWARGRRGITLANEAYGEGGWQPGPSVEAQVQEWMQRVKDMGGDPNEPVIREMVEGWPKKSVLRMGDHQITYSHVPSVSEAVHQRTMKQIEAIAEAYPVPVDVRVGWNDNPSLGGDPADAASVGGATAPGEGDFGIVLNPGWASRTLDGSEGFGPSSAGVNASQWALAHEWGHVMQYTVAPRGLDGDLVIFSDDMGISEGRGRYYLRHGEQVPEAFAELWFGGTGNPAAAYLVERLAEGRDEFITLPDGRVVPIEKLAGCPLEELGMAWLTVPTELAKHLPGQHDQQSHGNWARGRRNGSEPLPNPIGGTVWYHASRRGVESWQSDPVSPNNADPNVFLGTHFTADPTIGLTILGDLPGSPGTDRGTIYAVEITAQHPKVYGPDPSEVSVAGMGMYQDPGLGLSRGEHQLQQEMLAYALEQGLVKPEDFLGGPEWQPRSVTQDMQDPSEAPDWSVRLDDGSYTSIPSMVEVLMEQGGGELRAPEAFPQSAQEARNLVVRVTPHMVINDEGQQIQAMGTPYLASTEGGASSGFVNFRTVNRYVWDVEVSYDSSWKRRDWDEWRAIEGRMAEGASLLEAVSESASTWFDSGSSPLTGAARAIYQWNKSMSTAVKRRMAGAFREHLIEQGYDSILYLNTTEGRWSNHDARFTWSAIPLHDSDITEVGQTAFAERGRRGTEPYEFITLPNGTVIPIAKHLPGQHDQQSHGNWARGRRRQGDGELVLANEDAAPAHLRHLRRAHLPGALLTYEQMAELDDVQRSLVRQAEYLLGGGGSEPGAGERLREVIAEEVTASALDQQQRRAAILTTVLDHLDTELADRRDTAREVLGQLDQADLDRLDPGARQAIYDAERVMADPEGRALSNLVSTREDLVRNINRVFENEGWEITERVQQMEEVLRRYDDQFNIPEAFPNAEQPRLAEARQLVLPDTTGEQGPSLFAVEPGSPQDVAALRGSLRGSENQMADPELGVLQLAVFGGEFDPAVLQDATAPGWVDTTAMAYVNTISSEIGHGTSLDGAVVQFQNGTLVALWQEPPVGLLPDDVTSDLLRGNMVYLWAEGQDAVSAWQRADELGLHEQVEGLSPAYDSILDHLDTDAMVAVGRDDLDSEEWHGGGRELEDQGNDDLRRRLERLDTGDSLTGEALDGLQEVARARSLDSEYELSEVRRRDRAERLATQLERGAGTLESEAGRRFQAQQGALEELDYRRDQEESRSEWDEEQQQYEPSSRVDWEPIEEAAVATIKAQVEAHTEQAFHTLGYDITKQITRVGGGVVHVKFNFRDRDTHATGEASLSVNLDTRQVHAGYMNLDSAMQGKGVATTLWASLLPMVTELEIRKIDMNANITNGAYTWAKFGFLSESSDRWDYIRREVRSRMEEPTWLRRREENPGWAYEVDQALDSDSRTALWEFVDVEGDNPDTGYAYVSELLYGFSYDAYLDFTDEAAAGRLYRAMGLEFITLGDGRVVPIAP